MIAPATRIAPVSAAITVVRGAMPKRSRSSAGSDGPNPGRRDAGIPETLGVAIPGVSSSGVALRTDTDRLHLARAVELAARGTGRVSPNPVVGAVLVRDGAVLGE